MSGGSMETSGSQPLASPAPEKWIHHTYAYSENLRDSVVMSAPRLAACETSRRRIQSLAVHNSRDDKFGPRFYPSSDLDRLLTRSHIEEVLLCDCTSCATKVELRKPGSINDSSAKIRTVKRLPWFNGNDAISLFSLLVFIGCPQFIHAFLKILSDLPRSPGELTAKLLTEKVWKRFHEQHTEASTSLAIEFQEQKFKFSAPRINDDVYDVWDVGVTLPFFNEVRIDEGAFGRVYSFEIREEYRDFRESRGIRRFARKELRTTIPVLFENERANLQFVKRLADPHLISFVKAYKHGDTYNLVFPCARTNLDKYLRDRHFETPEMFNDHIELHPFWKQMYGIAGALHTIHSCTVPGGQRDFNLYGYHFDIKPANILVENNGKFVITDFGQANFKQKAGTSRVTGMGGTEAYAPPEIEQRDAKPNRKYDVWSLGCVFLELCAFVALRYEGVAKLDELKLSRSEDGRREFESFYQATSVPGSYQLKPSIVKWIREMPESMNVTKDSREFLGQMLDLTERMLQVNVEDRLTSQEVLTKMHSIMKIGLETKGHNPRLDVQDLPLEIDEVDLCEGGLKDLPLLSQISKSGQEKRSLRITERKGAINLIAVQDNEVERLDIGPRSATELIPQYAFHDESHNPLSGSHIILMPGETFNGARIRPVPLVFNEIRDSYILQSSLTHQDVRRSLSLRNFELQLGFRQRTKRRLQGKSALDRETLGKMSTIQLWSERTHQNLVPRSPIDSRPFSPTTTRFAIFRPAKQRIVIYSASTIIAIVLNKASRLHREGPTELRLVPMDISTKSEFGAHIIATRTAVLPPSLPLGREKLDQIEEAGEFGCQGMAFTFQTDQDAEAFLDTYKAIKEQWTMELRQQRQSSYDMRDLIGRGHD